MQYKTYETTEKVEAVLAALSKRKSKAAICRSIGANAGSLDEWIQKFRAGGTKALERRPAAKQVHKVMLELKQVPQDQSINAQRTAVGNG